MKQSDRVSVLNSFQSNYYHTLIGCKALFDERVLMFQILILQRQLFPKQKQVDKEFKRLGRTIRKSKGKDKPIIYTLYTTEDEYSELYEEQFSNPHIEVEWQEVK